MQYWLELNFSAAKLQNIELFYKLTFRRQCLNNLSNLFKKIKINLILFSNLHGGVFYCL